MRATISPALIVIAALLFHVVSALGQMRPDESWQDQDAADNFRISSWIESNTQPYPASMPDIAYNSSSDKLLAVWEGNTTPGELANPKTAIFGQALYGYNSRPGSGLLLISYMGDMMDPDYDARNPAVACSTLDEMCLVVWEGTADPEAGWDYTEIYGQFIEKGRYHRHEISFRISAMEEADNPTPKAIEPDVVYNSDENTFLVVWAGDMDYNDDFDVFGNVVDAETGDVSKTAEIRFSTHGQDNDPDTFLRDPALAYDPDSNSYVVVMEQGSTTKGEEVFSLWMSADFGSMAGVGVSRTGPDTDSRFVARDPAVVYNHREDEYLVTWSAVLTAGDSNSKYEIFGIRLDQDGLKIEEDEFRISQTYGDNAKKYDAFAPSVSYDLDQNEYLVAWYGSLKSGDPPSGEFEIFSRHIDPDGTPDGVSQQRVSTMGTDGDDSAYGKSPAVAYNYSSEEHVIVWYGQHHSEQGDEIFGRPIGPVGSVENEEQYYVRQLWRYFTTFNPAIDCNGNRNECLVAWTGNQWGTALVRKEREVWGRRINATTGEPVEDEDFRISTMGPRWDPDYYGRDPDVVFNSKDKEYLVVWRGMDRDELSEEIFARRIDAGNGQLLGVERKIISESLASEDVGSFASHPAVAYSPFHNAYLVVWTGDLRDGTTSSHETEIMGRRIDATTEYIDQHAFRISDIGPDGDEDLVASDPDVVYNRKQKEYMVTWRGKNSVAQGNEIFIQRIDAETGEELGENDRKISRMGTNGSGHWCYDPAITWNNTDNEYLVVWEGTDNREDLDDKEVEIFGQLLDRAGEPVGRNDFRISRMGPDLNDDYYAGQPAVSYDSDGQRYLVVWNGCDNENGIVRYEDEIFGRYFGPDGFPLAPMFRISFTAEDANAYRDAYDAALAHNAANGSFIVTWDSDHRAEKAFEIFGAIVGAESATADQVETPGNPALEPFGVFPNPFQERFEISLAVDKTQPVQVRVTDILGRHVLMPPMMDALPGTRIRIPVEAGTLPSGSYFVTLQGTTFRRTFPVVKIN